MSLKLRVKEGPSKGLETPLVDGLEIGREVVFFPLNDNKISGRHGVFRQEANGSWVFIDLGSKNGTFFEAKKVSKVELAEGTSFRVGNTILEVVTATAPAPDKKTWGELLEGAFLQAHEVLEDNGEELTPFYRPLQLQMNSGPQIDTTWIMAYGPRLVGQGSEDFPIYLEDAPEICFEVVPLAQGVKIINHAKDFVFFNDSSFREQNVMPGDRIKLGPIEIVLDYL